MATGILELFSRCNTYSSKMCRSTQLVSYCMPAPRVGVRARVRVGLRVRVEVRVGIRMGLRVRVRVRVEVRVGVRMGLRVRTRVRVRAICANRCPG